MSNNRASKKSPLPAHTIVDVINWRTARRKRAAWHAEAQRLRDENPKKWSWQGIAKHLSAKFKKTITRDAVIKACKRATGPAPSTVLTFVVDHVAETFSFVPPGSSTAVTVAIDHTVRTVSVFP
jgi:hypothetical protein